jgi:hypothetical protein
VAKLVSSAIPDAMLAKGKSSKSFEKKTISSLNSSTGACIFQVHHYGDTGMTSLRAVLSTLVAVSIGISSIACQAAHSSKPASTAAINKVKVDIDVTGIAKTVKVEVAPKDPYGPDADISLGGSPAHDLIIFDGKKTKYGDNSFNEPHMLVYPVAEYRALYPKSKQPEFNERIDNLKKITAAKSARGITTMPILPGSDGNEYLHAKEKIFNFKQGCGVSFISVYGNGDPPVNEADFFYTYQGLTSDGKYYVSFFWPIKATGLPKNLPLTKSKAYVQKLARTKFSPSLDVLDAVASSISVQ